MTHDNRITAIVHTYNAREHLGRVLDTLQGFDELLGSIWRAPMTPAT